MPYTVVRVPSGIPGTYSFLATVEHCSYPVCTVYARFITTYKDKSNESKAIIEILWSYTVPSERRKGARTAIHEYMKDWSYVTKIVTQTGADGGGQEFLEKEGFKLIKSNKRYELRV